MLITTPTGTAIAQFERVALKEHASGVPRLDDTVVPDPVAHETAIVVRLLKLVTPVEFNPVLPSGAVPANSVPWVHAGALLPSWDATYELRVPYRGESLADLWARRVWYWRMPKQEDLFLSWELSGEEMGARTGWLQRRDEQVESGTREQNQDQDQDQENVQEQVQDQENVQAQAQEQEQLDEWQPQPVEEQQKTPYLSGTTYALRALRTMPEGTWDF